MSAADRERGLWIPEHVDDVPRYCDAIGCGCVVPKELRVYWRGPRHRVLVCPSSRVAATLTPAAPILVMGGGWRGELPA